MSTDGAPNGEKTDFRAAAITECVWKLSQVQSKAEAIQALTALYNAAFLRGVALSDEIPTVREDKR